MGGLVLDFFIVSWCGDFFVFLAGILSFVLLGSSWILCFLLGVVGLFLV